jgi:8-amino-7-oxononanoate synthase
MNSFPKKLSDKLQLRQKESALRSLSTPCFKIDFYSNDYLGLAQNKDLFEATHLFLVQNQWQTNGSTGSRLISGNHPLFELTERTISDFHACEAALIFNSGFDANIGFFSAVPQRQDLILYDELSHASIREGIKISDAKSFKFSHNDVQHLEDLIQKNRQLHEECYIVTESVFSMDGDCAPLEKMVALAKKFDCKLIVDEAHALGILGNRGEGLCQALGISDAVFARIITFGKALGCHGAAVAGCEILKTYLLNFARSFIYTTALSPHAVASILIHYQYLKENQPLISKLQQKIVYYQNLAQNLPVDSSKNPTAIQTLTFGNLSETQRIAHELQEKGFGVKAILSPTVKKGQERIRICLHSFNSTQEIDLFFECLKMEI